MSSSAAAASAVEAMRVYCHLDDPDLVHVAIAVAATSIRDGDPLWLMVVGPPSSGKTEALRALDDCTDAHMDEVTAAVLISCPYLLAKKTAFEADFHSRGDVAQGSGGLPGGVSGTSTAAMSWLLAQGRQRITNGKRRPGGSCQCSRRLQRPHKGHRTQDIEHMSHACNQLARHGSYALPR